MPSVSIHLNPTDLDRLRALQVRLRVGQGRPLSRGKTVALLISRATGEERVQLASTDKLRDELHEIDVLIQAVIDRRARLVMAMRVRDRHRNGQTSITDNTNTRETT